MHFTVLVWKSRMTLLWRWWGTNSYNSEDVINHLIFHLKKVYGIIILLCYIIDVKIEVLNVDFQQFFKYYCKNIRTETYTRLTVSFPRQQIKVLHYVTFITLFIIRITYSLFLKSQ